MERFKRRFYDSHPKLPLDPDSATFKVVRPIHTDSAHIAVVAFGAFFGTLARYEVGLWLPNAKDAWPTTTLFINTIGSFLLGLLLQALLHRGKDEGGKRILRLLLGTGFLGAFTTYSSLAISVVFLSIQNEGGLALLCAAVSVLSGIVACALGIRLALFHNKQRTGMKA